MIKLRRFHHAEDFLSLVGEALYMDEMLNCLLLGIVERLTTQPDYFGSAPYLAVLSDGDAPVLAAAMTPPYGLLVAPLTEDPEAAMPLLVQDLVMGGWPLPDVQGQVPHSKKFAELWAARTGGRFEIEMAQRLYALHEVHAPADVHGKMIQAGKEHSELIGRWLRGFDRDAFGGEVRTEEQYQRAAGNRVAAGDWYLWLMDGEPVSMCLITRPLKQGVSVTGVYTPPEYRRHGYASACVAALSQKLLDDGFTYTTLFTDLANPTSNSIYMKIGYQPVADFDKYKLILPEAAA
ncbi:MAG: GNAT family N-acetyltransferase [Anaerolineales bacterium]